MKILFFLFLLFLIKIINSQINITSSNSITTFSEDDRYTATFLRDNGNSLIVGVYSYTFNLVKIDISQNQIKILGNYYATGQISPFRYLYFINGYILACSAMNPPRIFQQKSFTFKGNLNYHANFVRGQLITNKNEFVFSQNNGKVGYFDVKNIAKVTPIFLNTDTKKGFAFVHKSSDQFYVAISYMLSNEITIWGTMQWNLLKNITLSEQGVGTTYFTEDDHFFIVFLYKSPYIEIYDRQNDWILYKKILVNYSKVKSCFYVEQTNSLAALSQSSQTLFVMSLNDYTIQQIHQFQGIRMHLNNQNNKITAFSLNEKNIYIKNLSPYCQQNQFFDKVLRQCYQRNLTGCSKYYSIDSCQSCEPNYFLLKQKCITYKQYLLLYPWFFPGNNFYLPFDSIQLSSVWISEQVKTNPFVYQNIMFRSRNPLLLQSQSIQFINDYTIYINRKNHGKYFQLILNHYVNVNNLKSLSEIPLIGIISKLIFSLFISIDKLLLYIYHKRNYGFLVSQMMYGLRNFEQMKWKLLSDQVLNNVKFINQTEIINFLDTKKSYASWRVLLIDDQSSSFLVNNFYFFIMYVPVIIICFYTLQIICKLSIKFNLYIVFYRYKLNGLLLTLIMDGTIQIFTFWFVSDCIQLFQLKFYQKILNLSTILLMFLFLLYVSTFNYIIKYLYKKRESSKHFLGNYRNNLRALFQILIQNCFHNCSLGAAHLLLQNYYEIQMLTLFIIQSFYIILTINAIIKKKIFKQKSLQWLKIFSAFLRLCFISIYYTQFFNFGQIDLFQEIQYKLILMFIYQWIIIMILKIMSSLLLPIVKFIKYFQILKKAQKGLKIDKFKNNYINQRQLNQKINKIIAKKVSLINKPIISIAIQKKKFLQIKQKRWRIKNKEDSRLIMSPINK